MPAFVIFKSEFAVRAENDKLSRENAKLRDEVIRLKTMVGEPITEKDLARIVLPAAGESFTSGDCTVTIQPAGGARKPASGGGGGGATVEMNPAVARARGKKAGPAIPLGADLPASTQTETEETEAQPAVIRQGQGAPEVDNSDAAVRFKLLELR